MESQDRKFGFEFDTHYRAFSFRVVGAKRSREEVLDSFYERIQAAFKCLEDLVYGNDTHTHTERHRHACAHPLCHILTLIGHDPDLPFVLMHSQSLNEDTKNTLK